MRYCVTENFIFVAASSDNHVTCNQKQDVKPCFNK